MLTRARWFFVAVVAVRLVTSGSQTGRLATLALWGILLLVALGNAALTAALRTGDLGDVTPEQLRLGTWLLDSAVVIAVVILSWDAPLLGEPWAGLLVLPLAGAMRYDLLGGLVGSAIGAGTLVIGTTTADFPVPDEWTITRAVVLVGAGTVVGLLRQHLTAWRERTQVATESADRTTAILDHLAAGLETGRDHRDLAMLARIRRGEVDLDRSPVDLAPLVHDAIATQDLPEVEEHLMSGVVADVDAGAFQRAVTLILDNARMHGAPPVTVRLSSEGDTARLEIRDHGDGIPDADRSSLFEGGGPNELMRGFSLWLAREILRTHGGSLDYEASPPRGAVLVLRLPLVSHQIDAGHPTPANHQPGTGPRR